MTKREKKRKREVAMLGNSYIYSRFLRRKVIAVFLLGLMAVVNPAGAYITDLQPEQSLDNLEHQHIFRNGDYVATAAPSLQSGVPGVDNFRTITDLHLDQAIAYSASGAGELQVYQHVFAYSLETLPEPEDFSYAVNNQSGHVQTVIISKEEASAALKGRKVKVGKSITAKSSIILDGSLLLLKKPEMSSYEGLWAAFEVLVTQERERKTRKGTKTVTKKLLKGSVKIYGKKNGKIKIKTTGKIKKKHIADFKSKIRKELKRPGDMFKIDFNDVAIGYRVRTKVGEEFKIRTSVTSQVITKGPGTGAEVIFAPEDYELVVPTLQESGQVPEPGTFLLLIGGSMGIFLNGRAKFLRRKFAP